MPKEAKMPQREVAPFASIEMIVSDAMPADASPLPLNGKLYVSRQYYDRLVSKLADANVSGKI